MRKNRKYMVMVAAIVMVCMLLTGCRNDASTPTNQNAGAPVENPFPGENLDTLNLSGHNDWTWIADEKGWLDERFRQHGINVEIVMGTLGNEVQLMARDELHFAFRMIHPFFLFRGAGADISIVHVSANPHPEIGSILVLADSPFYSMEDLKGGIIGSGRAGCPYLILNELTEAQGWVEGVDWTFANVPGGEARTALLAGDLDAICVHVQGDLAQLVISGIAREIAHPAEDSIYIQGGGSMVIFSPSIFPQNYPAITREVIDLQIYTQQWMLNNPEEAADIIYRVRRIPQEISIHSWNVFRSAWGTTDLHVDVIIEQMQGLHDWMVDHGDIQPFDIGAAFDRQFFD